jgi:hypothetical protein
MSMADAEGRWRTGARGLAAIAVATCGLAVAPSAAFADAGLGVTSTIPRPEVVVLGATGVPASLTLTNLNTGNETIATICNAGEGLPCTPGGAGITFVPSCAGQDAVSLACAVPTPGVFRVGPTARGAVGTACAGMPFTVEPLGDAVGTVLFRPQVGAHIQLPTPGSTCQIDFTMDVLSLPQDVDLAVDGAQTIQVSNATQRSDNQKTAAGNGRAVVTVPPPPAPPPPTPPPTPTPPQSGVSPTAGSSGSPASATIHGPTGCATKNFNVTVTGKQIRKVVFFLNGKRIKTLSKPNAGRAFRLPVRPGTLKRGTHHITATATFTKASGARPRTLRVTFLRCARAASSPQFTG